MKIINVCYVPIQENAVKRLSLCVILLGLSPVPGLKDLAHNKTRNMLICPGNKFYETLSDIFIFPLFVNTNKN
jgi:hypothetical protein